MDIAEPILNLFKKKTTPNVEVGDTVRVHHKIKEGNKERIQVFEGVVIAKHNRKDLDATFTVRKIASGIGVEKTFLLHSPNIAKVEFKRGSHVRRAKLYFLRNLTGKALRLKEKKGVLKDSWELIAADEQAPTAASEEDIAEAVAAEEARKQTDIQTDEVSPEVSEVQAESGKVEEGDQPLSTEPLEETKDDNQSTRGTDAGEGAAGSSDRESTQGTGQ